MLTAPTISKLEVNQINAALLQISQSLPTSVNQTNVIVKSDLTVSDQDAVLGLNNDVLTSTISLLRIGNVVRLYGRTGIISEITI